MLEKDLQQAGTAVTCLALRTESWGQSLRGGLPEILGVPESSSVERESLLRLVASELAEIDTRKASWLGPTA